MFNLLSTPFSNGNTNNTKLKWIEFIVAKYTKRQSKSKADDKVGIFSLIQRERNLRALPSSKQMARQLVGLSAMLQYMFRDMSNKCCAE